MYRGFNLKISMSDFDSADKALLMAAGEKINNANESMDSTLSYLTNDGIIDGTGLSDIWFETTQPDVFISHSHNDQELATVFSGWLQEFFGLNVFLDKNVWGNTDALLKSIDDIYCKTTAGHYDYSKRNYSTSHVHAMLATALMKVMDQSEIVIFLNTPESIPTISQTMKEQDEYTLSPWIYEELVITTVLRERSWSEYRMESSLVHSAKKSASLWVKYKAPTERLTPIDVTHLNNWCEAYKTIQTDNLNFTPHDHPLNCLYKTVFGIEE